MNEFTQNINNRRQSSKKDLMKTTRSRGGSKTHLSNDRPRETSGYEIDESRSDIDNNNNSEKQKSTRNQASTGGLSRDGMIYYRYNYIKTLSNRTEMSCMVVLFFFKRKRIKILNENLRKQRIVQMGYFD